MAGYAQDLMNSAPMIAKLSPKSPNAMTPPTQSLCVSMNNEDLRPTCGTHDDP